MIESHRIPEIAKTAQRLAWASYLNQLDAIGHQTAAALGLDPDGDWQVNFNTGVVTREVPDPAAPPGAPT